jgi:hypothetical protein
MVEKDEAKIFKALMEGMDAVLYRVTWLQVLIIIMLGLNIVILLKLMYP